MYSCIEKEYHCVNYADMVISQPWACFYIKHQNLMAWNPWVVKGERKNSLYYEKHLTLRLDAELRKKDYLPISTPHIIESSRLAYQHVFVCLKCSESNKYNLLHHQWVCQSFLSFFNAPLLRNRACDESVRSVRSSEQRLWIWKMN